ncbi:MAG: hypothetical protein Q9196_007477, partial [Gyalolechia fulgens]
MLDAGRYEDMLYKTIQSPRSGPSLLIQVVPSGKVGKHITPSSFVSAAATEDAVDERRFLQLSIDTVKEQTGCRHNTVMRLLELTGGNVDEAVSLHLAETTEFPKKTLQTQRVLLGGMLGTWADEWSD